MQRADNAAALLTTVDADYSLQPLPGSLQWMIDSLQWMYYSL